jgi:hypothetical protein
MLVSESDKQQGSYRYGGYGTYSGFNFAYIKYMDLEIQIMNNSFINASRLQLKYYDHSCDVPFNIHDNELIKAVRAEIKISSYCIFLTEESKHAGSAPLRFGGYYIHRDAILPLCAFLDVFHPGNQIEFKIKKLIMLYMNTPHRTLSNDDMLTLIITLDEDLKSKDQELKLLKDTLCIKNDLIRPLYDMTVHNDLIIRSQQDELLKANSELQCQKELISLLYADLGKANVF